MQIVEPLLGTRAEVHATASSAELASAAERAVLDEVARLEQVFTVYDEMSALHDLRRTGETDVAELVEVVSLARYWQRTSQGAFNAQTQQLTDLWDHCESADRLPTSAQLEAARTRGQARSAVDNLNAIAKGWIAQAAVHSVDIGAGIDALWLSLGGDIVHAGSGTVRVGIEDPHRPYDNVAPLAKVEISNEAIATSGGARRWWTIGGQRYSKVIDPRTGWPVEQVQSATIVAGDAAVADALATIATVASTEETLALVDDAEAACLLVHPDGSRTCSSSRFVLSS